MKQLLLFFGIAMFFFTTSCSPDNEREAVVENIKLNGPLEVADVTLTNGQTIQRSARWVYYNHLEPGDKINLGAYDYPDTLTMEIKQIEEVGGIDEKMYWIAYFMPVDINVHVNAQKIIYPARPSIGQTERFWLLYSAMGYPGGYELVINEPSPTEISQTNTKIKKLFSEMKGDENVLSRKLYPEGGFHVVFVERGRRYTIYCSEDNPEHSIMSFWVRSNGTTSDDSLITFTDNNLDGKVDFGITGTGEKKFRTARTSLPNGQGFEYEDYWQSEMDKALSDAFIHFSASGVSKP